MNFLPSGNSCPIIPPPPDWVGLALRFIFGGLSLAGLVVLFGLLIGGCAP